VLLEGPGGNVGFAAREFGGAYGLSAGETRVVAGLAHGRTPAEIAARTRTSVETVRTQLKRIFLKTGLRRQSDIVRSVCLLAGTVLNPATVADSE
jgi:DNA-binding CsgD family transcriptional regulator